jgi:DNA invertase Pin-like site-specific DNA recombinase
MKYGYAPVSTDGQSINAQVRRRTIAGQGAGFRSLADTWADATTPHGRLMLTVLGGLA